VRVLAVDRGAALSLLRLLLRGARTNGQLTDEQTIILQLDATRTTTAIGDGEKLTARRTSRENGQSVSV
jgi:hypothetical protein